MDVKYLTIGSLIERVRDKGKNFSDIKKVYVVSNTMGILPEEEYRENLLHSEDTSNYTVIRKGMFVYNPSRLNIGSIGMLKKNECGLVSPMYVVFKIDESKVCGEYFEYLLKSDFIKKKIDSLKESGARFRFDFSRWNWIKIPVPPVQEQLKIISSLNTFIKLKNSIINELELRRKQYEYYRDSLLTFGDDVVYKSLKNLCTIKTGQKPKEIESNKLKFEYINAGTTLSGYIDEYNCKGDTVTTPSRGQGGIGYVGYQKSPFWLGPLCYQIRSCTSDILNKYIYYYLVSNNHLILQFKKEGGTPAINRSDLEQILIPVPSLSEQEYIVSILDCFDTLCNDPTSGLPAEIEARQKQYEYYRDKLLDFKKAE